MSEKIRSEETKRKISESLRGNKNGSANKGKKLRLTEKRKLADEKRKITMLGNKYRVGNKSNTGKKLSLETRKKMSESRKGNKSNLWKGGISKENRTERENFMNSFEYKEWRHNVYERDNYTCQECGDRGGKLNAHHIKKYSDYPELRLSLDNGVTLCEECHHNAHRKSGKPSQFG